MKKLVSLLLVAVLLCFSVSALAYSPEEPITSQFWHTRGSGAQQETMNYQIDAFNETVGKEKGIIVEGTYIGGYADIMAKVQLSVASSEQPVVCITGNTRIAILQEDGILEDMLPYAKASGLDLTNFYPGMINVPYNDENQLYSLPYIKSTPVLYYNKSIADAKGIVVPDHMTMDQLEEICKAAYTVADNGEVEIWGFESVNDFTYYQGAFLWQLGEELWNAEGESPALEGTSMLKVLSDWRRWVDEGWCRPFDSTNASNILTEMFYQGKMFAFWNSCASMSNIARYSKEAGIELGVTNLPTYVADNPVVPIGGGNITLVGQNNTEEQKQAGWEFINFLMSDEMVAYNAIHSGYLPTTATVANNEEMQKFWEENPIFKVAYDQLPNGIEQSWPYFEYNSEFKTNIQAVVSRLVQEKSIDTAEEAVEAIKTECAHLF